MTHLNTKDRKKNQLKKYGLGCIVALSLALSSTAAFSHTIYGTLIIENKLNYRLDFTAHAYCSAHWYGKKCRCHVKYWIEDRPGMRMGDIVWGGTNIMLDPNDTLLVLPSLDVAKDTHNNCSVLFFRGKRLAFFSSFQLANYYNNKHGYDWKHAYIALSTSNTQGLDRTSYFLYPQFEDLMHQNMGGDLYYNVKYDLTNR